MRIALATCLILLSCGDDSAPPANPDAPVDARVIDAPGGTGGGTGGTGGTAGNPGDGGPDAQYVCPLTCTDPNSTCVDNDGPGPNNPFCGCANDAFCQNTGHCVMNGTFVGTCRCGNGPGCVPGQTICVNNQCMNPDGGTL